MRPISINLARRPFYNRTLYLVVYGLSAATLLVMTTLNAFTFVADRVALGRLADARNVLQREIAQLDREDSRIRRSLRGIRLNQLGVQSEFAQDALLQRYFSWTRLFNWLEQVMPPDVKLRSIRPIPAETSVQIRVTGYAKSPEAFTDFEEQLILSPVFADVYPTNEVWLGERRGLEFGLGFRYLPDRALEEAAVADPSTTAARTEVGIGEEGGAP